MDQDTTHKTISEAIGADHAYMDLCGSELKNAKTLDEQIRWRNQLTWTFARHAISEELTVYPAMEKHLGAAGKEMTETDLVQHQAIKEDLYKLQSMSPSSPEFFPLLDRLLTDFHTHVEHEKNEDMPALEEKLSRGESNALARSWQRTKMITPTRSHPSAPNRPYAENLAGLLALPVDKVGDWVRSFPVDTKMEVGSISSKGKL